MGIPSKALHWWKQALAHHEAGQLGKARALYEKLIVRCPHCSVGVHNNMALLLDALGDEDSASAAWRRGWMLFPGNELLMQNIVYVNPYSSWSTIRPKKSGLIIWLANRLVTGLGDRMATYLTAATVAQLLEATVLTRWPTADDDTSDEEQRSTHYPSSIFEYLSLPPELSFEQDTQPKLGGAQVRVLHTAALPAFNWGFDLVPETMHKMLSKAGLIKFSFKRYLQAYMRVVSSIELKHQRLLALLPPTPYVGVHARRGDLAKDNAETQHHDAYLIALLKSKVAQQPDARFLVVSDNVTLRNAVSAELPTENMVTLALVPEEEQPLLDFFALARSSLIVQSVPGDDNFGGWSSFSYVASRIAGCPLEAYVNNGTRLHAMLQFASKPLANITVHVVPLGPSDRGMFKIALAHHEAGRLAEARPLYEKLVESNPEFSADLHNNLALLLVAIGKSKAARRVWRRGSNLFPENEKLQNNYAIIHATGEIS
eukprot:CAMPEP_0119306082 /NCGR_PEP_ID=MMETSP1333-20130426/6907_1 /TAXON_ID=418940 /ORGANISM="Scyphosphaera apsteinii, Strain RCC1455" /LENGTH=485 /DNA_ID=CAMNT_0007309299 /DNA_START=77 /DNA_END=1534 /DNA_ORIENTATION=+